MYADFHCYIANNYGPVIGILKRDCLRLFVVIQTCNVDVVLLVMYCIYIQAFIVTSADISQLWVYFTNLLPEAICCCLHLSCLWNVGDIVLHMCTYFHGHLC